MPAVPTTAHPSPPPAGKSGGLQGYRPAPGVHDEMLAPDGTLRPHWKVFGSFLAQCGAEDFNSRVAAIQRLLRDHGVTYNVYDDALGTSRPWSLDVLPFLMAEEEWRRVSAGLDQRARLLNAILADLYGPQTLIAEGLLPPRLLHANPGFLRPAVGISPPGGRWIFTLATDLVRAPSGQWLVLNDRAERPTGHGYALENRVILSNVFPEEFNASRVRRLAAHYDWKREMLQSLAPKTRHGSAGILMLTPGPRHETYYEHTYLARHLGFPLVEGADLTTRDRTLYLKTLEGLHRVDVMVRHVDDRWCDPLELRAGSLIGVAGLVEAWRNGSVTLANGLGAGIVDTPALHPFLPGICRHLFGAELLLPCVPTWWCGQQRELDLVLSQPDRWVVKPAFARGGRDPVFLADLDAEQKARQLDAIRASPHEWVAQEVLALSTTPTWTGARLEPRPLVWRSFCLARGEGFETMPGGLARVSPEPGRWLITLRGGGISKDTWIVGSETAPAQPAPQRDTSVIRPARPPSGVPSRAADHLFWFGRYAERLEQTVRILRAIMQRLAGERSDSDQHELAGCSRLVQELGIIPHDTPVQDHLQPLTQDLQHQGSIPDLVSRMHFNAAAARDRLSDDTWRLVNRIERDARLPAGPFQPGVAQGMFDTLILDLAAISGMQQENMTRGHGWRFLEIGRRIERATSLSSLLSAATRVAAQDDRILPPLLEICDSRMTYRRLHFARPALIPVLDLLLLNNINPRSLAHQLAIIGRQTSQLPMTGHGPLSEASRRQADALLSDLSALSLDALSRTPRTVPDIISAFCDSFSSGLEKLSDHITEYYFSHAAGRPGRQAE